MHKFRAALVGLLLLVAVGGCTTNNTIANVSTPLPVMEMAVGTINDSAGVLSAQCGGCGTSPFLDVITTFRNTLGNSAFLHPNNATLTPGGTATGSFGGLFAYGQFPGTNGLPSAGPAWAAPGTGTGYDIDLNVGFLSLPGSVPTSFSMSTTVLFNGSSHQFNAGATLVSLALLPAPGAASYAANGATGGGTFTFSAAGAGVEQVAVVLLGAPPNAVLAMAEAPPGATSATLPAGTLTPATVYTCFVVAADFNWVESGAVNAPTVGVQSPHITTNVINQADLSSGATFACTG